MHAAMHIEKIVFLFFFCHCQWFYFHPPKLLQKLS